MIGFHEFCLGTLMKNTQFGFPFLSLVCCYLLCVVKYWPGGHFVTVNLDSLDSPRKCVSVASTFAPSRALPWWTFQRAPRWRMSRSGQLLWRMFPWCPKCGASEWPFSSSLPTFCFCAKGLPSFDFQELVLLPGWWLRDTVKWGMVKSASWYITHYVYIYNYIYNLQ